MADVTITGLNALAPSTDTYVPISNGSTTGKAIYNPVPVGGIIMWSGSIISIPSGWALCNGQVSNGQTTPDLRDRFIVGAGSTYSLNDVGGLSAVQLTINEMPAHNHTAAIRSYTVGGGGNGPWPIVGGTVNAGGSISMNNTGGDQPHENRPPYYALAYIMRTI